MFGFFKKKPAAHKPLPSLEREPVRYEGRPLFIVMENYVLDCIGELPPEKQDLARYVVQRVWGGGEDWKKTVREQLYLEPTIDQEIRDLWARNLVTGERSSQQLHPMQFAKMVVDENFQVDRLTASGEA